MNNDGVLDEEEQRAMVNAFGLEYQDAIVTLGLADENHNGVLDVHELANMLSADTESEDGDSQS